MANPVSDNYTAPSGGSIYAGMVAPTPPEPDSTEDE